MIASGSRRLWIGAAFVAGSLVWLVLVPAHVALPAPRALFLARGLRLGRSLGLLVARRPVELILPRGRLAVRLLASGPTPLELRGDGVERREALGDEPHALDVELPSGGPLRLAPEATLRLYRIEVTRRSESLSDRLAFGWFHLRATTARWTPALTALALAASPLLILWLPRRRAPSVRAGPIPWVFGLLVLASCLYQVWSQPQPKLIGDPAAYHDIGGRFREALGGVRGLDDLADALETLRPYAGLWATGVLYGLLRGLRDSLAAVYLAQALATALMVVFLVRAALGIGGRTLGLVVGIASLAYPTLPILCGLVQPEPFIMLAWVAAFECGLAAARGDSSRGFAVAGLLFGIGLALHPQGLTYLVLALLLLLLPFAKQLSSPTLRGQLAAFGCGLMPVVLAGSVGAAWAEPLAGVLDERYGFFAFSADYPLGCWLFLETDGWQGAEHLWETEYVRGLRSAESAGAAQGSLGRWRYTADFLRKHALETLRVWLRNVDRLYRYPDNPPRRPYLMRLADQVAWHRVLVVWLLVGVPLVIGRREGWLLVPFAILAMTYPVYHIVNKYAVPAAPFVLLGASLCLVRGRLRPAPLILAAAAVLLDALVTPGALALRGLPVGVSRWTAATLSLGTLGSAFLCALSRWARAPLERLGTLCALAFALLPAAARGWNDPGWRAFDVSLDREASIRLDIGGDGLARASAAREAYLLLDLQVADGDPNRIQLTFDGGFTAPGRELAPTMPPYGLATYRYGRDPRSFRQWWRLAWRPEMAPDGRLDLRVTGGPADRLFGSLARPAEPPTEQLSLGQPPYHSLYRLFHEDEYRLPLSQPLARRAASSAWAGHVLPGPLGVHLVILDDDAGVGRWRTAPALAAEVVTAIWARTGPEFVGDLSRAATSLRFNSSDGGRGPALEVRPLSPGAHAGWYAIRSAAELGKALELEVRPRLEMWSGPRYFLPELRAGKPVPPEWADRPFVAAAEILEARAVPGWRPLVVF